MGGIVDVRGNAYIDGTILSMYDPSSKGEEAKSYATNIGFSDENIESRIPEDCGEIRISPNPQRLLPNGIICPVVIGQADSNSYTEI